MRGLARETRVGRRLNSMNILRGRKRTQLQAENEGRLAQQEGEFQLKKWQLELESKKEEEKELSS